jgi:hypothetical protein
VPELVAEEYPDDVVSDRNTLADALVNSIHLTSEYLITGFIADWGKKWEKAMGAQLVGSTNLIN